MSALNIDCGRVDSLKGVTGHDLSEHDLGVFARLLAIYLSHDEQDREGIATMASIVADRNATPDEIEAALETIREGLYPTQPIDLGLDGEWEPGENRASEEMDLQESTFANRLDELMRLKRISQVQLAEAIGVGQPAISMMLARSCRPQRRTVEKLARALGVAPSDLWPDNLAQGAVKSESAAHGSPGSALLGSLGNFDFFVPTEKPYHTFSDTKTRVHLDLDLPPSDPRPIAA